MTQPPSSPPSRRRPRPAGARPGGRPTQASTKVGILKSAARAFRRRGYHGSTVEEIASALGMNKGNLYYYFRNKEDILYACHEYSLDILLGIVDQVQQSTAPPDVKLRRLISAFVETIVDELGGTALFLDLQPLAPTHLRTIIARRDRYDTAIRQVIREGIDQGVFAPVDPKLATFAILGAVNWIPSWFDPRGAASSRDIAAAFADYLLSGLRIGGSSAPPAPAVDVVPIER